MRRVRGDTGAAIGAPALFRVRLPDGATRLATGDSASGPRRLLPDAITVAGLMHDGAAALHDVAVSGPDAGPVPDGSVVVAPVDVQEVWAAGVTYERSREARAAESLEPSVYDRVYDAARPEIFFKTAGWRVRGPGETICIRADSDWDVPEPELGLVIDSRLEIAGFTIGNDVSSRSIEGANPLYLPQAKTYDGSCALGPAIVPAGLVNGPFDIRLRIERDGRDVLDGSTSTARIRRPFDELVEHAGRALTFPDGLVLLTGTGIVPPGDFSLRVGDRVSIAIGQLGVLENPVIRVGRGAPAS